MMLFKVLVQPLLVELRNGANSSGTCPLPENGLQLCQSGDNGARDDEKQFLNCGEINLFNNLVQRRILALVAKCLHPLNDGTVFVRLQLRRIAPLVRHLPCSHGNVSTAEGRQGLSNISRYSSGAAAKLIE